MKKTISSTLFALLMHSTSSVAEVRQLNYDRFTIWLDCDRHGPVKFQYNTTKDTGSYPRKISYTLDPNVPKQCQQKSVAPYGKNYDRGHLVPANHVDNSPLALTEVNYITNILPQTATMNRGAWYVTEEIIECYRDITDLTVVGGVIWGNNIKDDYFVSSHNIATPDAYWKVVYAKEGNGYSVISWIVPNTTDATRTKLDSYLVSVKEIEQISNEKINIPERFKNIKQAASWKLPKTCKLS